jgi:hypothetical protein
MMVVERKGVGGKKKEKKNWTTVLIMVVVLSSINSIESSFIELALFCHQRRPIITLYTPSYGLLI